MSADKEPRARYTAEIQAMMYTFGDVRTPVPASAQLIEQLVHKQLVDIIIQAAHIAQSVRCARSLSSEDIIFVIRRDSAKLSRLREFLLWKDLRKNIKANDEVSARELEGADDDHFLGLTNIEAATAGPSNLMTDIPIGKSTKYSSSLGKQRKRCILPWDNVANLVLEATEGRVDLLEEEPPSPESVQDSRRRLAEADRLTRDMSREEYMEYSECRQASFTYKKAKKFRDWLNPAKYMEFRLNDDVIEILGFLAWEMVRKVTDVSLQIKRLVEEANTDDMMGSGNGERSPPTDACDLFRGPTEQTAIMPHHVQQAIVMMGEQSRDPIAVALVGPRNRTRTRLRLY